MYTKNPLSLEQENSPQFMCNLIYKSFHPTHKNMY